MYVVLNFNKEVVKILVLLGKELEGRFMRIWVGWVKCVNYVDLEKIKRWFFFLLEENFFIFSKMVIEILFIIDSIDWVDIDDVLFIYI